MYDNGVSVGVNSNVCSSEIPPNCNIYEFKYYK